MEKVFYIDQKDSNRIRVAMPTYRGHTRLDLRHEYLKDGQWLKGKNAIMIFREHLDDFFNAIEELRDGLSNQANTGDRERKVS